MKHSTPHSSLDEALSIWAKQNDLSLESITAMRAEILATKPLGAESGESEPLPLNWWMEFSEGLNKSLHQALSPAALGTKLTPPIPLPGFG